MLSRCTPQWRTLYESTLQRSLASTRRLRASPVQARTQLAQKRYASTYRERSAVGVFTPVSAALFVATGVGLFFYFKHEKEQLQERKEQERASKQYGRPKLGGPFSLTTPEGTSFTDQDLLGKWSLVYFGFTNCPDICPQELDKMTDVLNVVESDYGKIFQPVFISVDPARDTPKRMGRYLKDFHSSFVGLVGSWDATKAVCKAYRVYFSTPPNADPNGDYLVDHSIFVYLLDPEGNFVEAFGQGVQKEQIVEKVGEFIEEWKKEIVAPQGFFFQRPRSRYTSFTSRGLGARMDALFQPLADLVGASVDQIKLISCLLVAYPLGSLYVRVPTSSPNLRHLFSITVALFFFFPVLKIYSAFFQLLASVLGTYFIARLDTSSRMPWIVFVFVMGHLTVNHVIRAVYGLSYETIEVTGPQMVLVMKLTTFAWNVYDGRRPAADLDKWQTEKRIVDYPSLLEFLGYSFYFPGMLVGPYLDLAEYRAVVTGALFQDAKVKEKMQPGRRLPSHRKRAAYTRLVLGLVYLGIFVVLGGSNNFSTALTPWFMKHDLYVRITLFQLYGFLERSKYYAIWTLTEGASILTGLGFTGFSASGEPTWDGAANVKVLWIELPSNFKTLLDSWNMKTNVWLRECVYKRITPKGKKPGFSSSMITFLTSAFWHGIAAGYYLTFLSGGFITTVARLVRGNVRPFFIGAPGQKDGDLKEVYDIIGTLFSIVILNYAAAPFMLLTFKDSITVWSRLGWYGHIIIFGGLAFFYAGGTKWLKSMHRKVPAQNGKDSPASSGTSTPVSEKTFTVPPSLDQVLPPAKK